MIAVCALPAFVAATTSAHATDPTQGRIQKRQSQNLGQYHKCADFSLRVYRAALSQAGGNSSKRRSAQAHYHGNLSRCRAKFL